MGEASNSSPQYAQSAEECQLMCQKDDTCVNFSFISTKPVCLMFYKVNDRTKNVDAVSGPKKCPGMCKS